VSYDLFTRRRDLPGYFSSRKCQFTDSSYSGKRDRATPCLNKITFVVKVSLTVYDAVNVGNDNYCETIIPVAAAIVSFCTDIRKRAFATVCCKIVRRSFEVIGIADAVRQITLRFSINYVSVLYKFQDIATCSGSRIYSFSVGGGMTSNDTSGRICV